VADVISHKMPDNFGQNAVKVFWGLSAAFLGKEQIVESVVMAANCLSYGRVNISNSRSLEEVVE
jgi:hypothetical protein